MCTMGGQIYVKDGEELHALSESAYEAEEMLQKLLADHPDLLAGEIKSRKLCNWRSARLQG